MIVLPGGRQEKIQIPKLRRCLDPPFLQLCWILNSQNLLVVFSSRNKTTPACTVGGSKQLTLISCSDDAYSVSSKFNILYRLFLKLFLAIFSRFPFIYFTKMHFLLLLVARTGSSSITKVLISNPGAFKVFLQLNFYYYLAAAIPIISLRGCNFTVKIDFLSFPTRR